MNLSNEDFCYPLILIARAALIISSAIHNPNGLDMPRDILDLTEVVVALYPKPKEDKEQGETE
jgi:hypothetical protein